MSNKNLKQFITDWVLLCSICRINRRTCKNEIWLKYIKEITQQCTIKEFKDERKENIMDNNKVEE